MNKYRPCLAFLLLLGVCLFSCEKYEPEGEYFKEIEVGQPEQLWVKLNSGVDTLAVSGEAVLFFEVPEHVRENVGYKLYLGNELIQERPYPPDLVMFETGLRQDGYYRLRLEFFVKSGTGSLADKVDMEFFVYEFRWVLKIDNRPLSDYPIHQFSVTEEEGRIKLTWPEYDLPGFTSYVIYRKENWGHETQKVIYVPDRKETTLYDDAYVGGFVTYTLQVNKQGWPDNIYGNPVELSAPFPELTKQEQKKDEFYLEWTACQYPKNFEAYEIYRYHFAGEQLVYRTTNIHDTTAHLPAAFGKLDYKLITKGKGIAEDMEGPVSEFQLSYGFSHALETVPHYLVSENAFLHTGEDGTFTKIDPATMEPLFSRQHARGFGLTISDNGEYIYYCTDSDFVRLSPVTLEVIERISTESLLGYAHSPRYLSVNNNNQLLFTGTVTGSGKVDSMTLVDMNSKQLLRRRPEPYDLHLSFGTLSNDGEYYLQHGSRVVPIFGEGEGPLLEFRAYLLPGSTRQVVYSNYNNNSLVVMDLANMQQLREIPISNGFYHISVDPLNGNVGGLQRREELLYYQIYNPATGALIKEIEVNTEYIEFRNNTLFTNESYLPLSML